MKNKVLVIVAFLLTLNFSCQATCNKVEKGVRLVRLVKLISPDGSQEKAFDEPFLFFFTKDREASKTEYAYCWELTLGDARRLAKIYNQHIGWTVEFRVNETDPSARRVAGLIINEPLNLSQLQAKYDRIEIVNTNSSISPFEL